MRGAVQQRWMIGEFRLSPTVECTAAVSILPSNSTGLEMPGSCRTPTVIGPLILHGQHFMRTAKRLTKERLLNGEDNLMLL